MIGKIFGISFFVLLGLLASATTAFGADPVLLKTGREVYASYQAIMNIDGSAADLRSLFRLNVDRLPKDGAAGELSSSVVLAATELSGVFCRKNIAAEKTLQHGERMLFGDVDFKRGPTQFDDYISGVMIDHLAVAFWQRNATAAEKQVLVQVVANASRGVADTPDETENVLRVLCTAFGTSLAFLVK